jgi:D-glycero-D-manno-heptose 1,7-bisphosphate phosphatase
MIIRQLVRHGFSRITLLTTHEAEKAANYSKYIRPAGAKFELVCEQEPLGNAGRLINILNRLDETFLLVNGGTYFDINLLGLIDVFHKDASAALALCETSDAVQPASIQLETDGRIGMFQNKPDRACNYGNSGTALLRRSAIEGLKPEFATLEQCVYPRLSDEGRLYGKFFARTILSAEDVGVRRELAQLDRRPAVFFDRDGTLNHDAGYTHKTEDLRWTEDAIAAIRNVNDAGYYAFVVTNQSGVARGFYAEAEIIRFHEHMQQELRRAGAHLDDLRYCPHHPKGVRQDYAISCLCRKPGTQMLRSLCEAWPVDIDHSVMVGDQETDRACAEAFGVKFVLATNGGLVKSLNPFLQNRKMQPCST